MPHHSAPRAHREPRLALAEVGQLPGEQLDVRPRNPARRTFTTTCPAPGTGLSHLGHPAVRGPSDHQYARQSGRFQSSGTVYPRWISMSARAIWTARHFTARSSMSVHFKRTTASWVAVPPSGAWPGRGHAARARLTVPAGQAPGATGQGAASVAAAQQAVNRWISSSGDSWRFRSPAASAASPPGSRYPPKRNCRVSRSAAALLTGRTPRPEPVRLPER